MSKKSSVEFLIHLFPAVGSVDALLSSAVTGGLSCSRQEPSTCERLQETADARTSEVKRHTEGKPIDSSSSSLKSTV